MYLCIGNVSEEVAGGGTIGSIEPRIGMQESSDDDLLK